MQKRKIKNLNSTIFVELLLLPCFKPDSLRYLLPLADQLFDFARVIVLVIVIFMYFYQGHISGILLAITSMQIARIFSTIMNDGDYWMLLVDAGSVFTVCMIVELGVRENVKTLFHAIIFDLSALCLFNLVTILLFPSGMYEATFTQNWLLGYDNNHVIFILPLLCFFSMYSKARKTSLLGRICYLAIISASVYITWSATSVLGCTFFLIIILMNELNFRPKVMNSYTYILAVLVAFLLIVVFQFLDIFKVIIVDFLHKDMTFTGRLRVWDTALYLITQKPFWGYGVADSATNKARLYGVGHTHNYFLQVVYEGGIISLICFAIIMLLVCKRLYAARETREGFLFSGMLFCLLLMSLDEAYTYSAPFYGAFTCMYYTKEVSHGLSQMRPARRFVIHHMIK